MRVSLVGSGVKILSVLLSILIGVFAYVVLFLVNDKSIIHSIFIVLVFIFCLFGTYIAYGYSVIVSKKNLVTKVPYKKEINICDIKKIYCSDDKTESSIYIELKGSVIVRLTGYMVLFNQMKGLDKTMQIVDELNDYIFKSNRYDL